MYLTLTGTITPGQSGHGCYSNDKHTTLPRSPKLEPHNQMLLSVIPRKHIFGVHRRVCKGYHWCIYAPPTAMQ